MDNKTLRTVLVFLAITAAILAVTAIPGFLCAHWPPFVGTAVAFGVAWIAAGIAGLISRRRVAK